jgi:hypothetical protein
MLLPSCQRANEMPVEITSGESWTCVHTILEDGPTGPQPSSIVFRLSIEGDHLVNGRNGIRSRILHNDENSLVALWPISQPYNAEAPVQASLYVVDKRHMTWAQGTVGPDWTLPAATGTCQQD